LPRQNWWLPESAATICFISQIMFTGASAMGLL
jgi:hypothetical protein